jgi:glycosyltransferase involved in cell wall biosynthesis
VRPLISVLVTCYNLGAYIDEAIDSVLNQTVQDFEILVIDDGSTDRATLDRLDAATWPRTTILRTPNQGLARGRNELIRRALGVYLCALDADDRLHPQYFERALAAFSQDPELAFVSSWLRMFGTEDRVWRQERCDLETLLAEDTVMTAALVRREVVSALGGYDEGMPAPGDEDWDLWIRVVAAGHRGTILPEVLFEYRRRPGSMGELCVAGETHLALLAYLMRKHRDLYAVHWPQVAARKDFETAYALRANREIELEIAEHLLPDIARMEREVARLRSKLTTTSPQPAGGAASPSQGTEPGATPTEIGALRQELGRAEQEIQALRTSWSWRLTAPLRRVYEVLRR